MFAIAPTEKNIQTGDEHFVKTKTSDAQCTVLRFFTAYISTSVKFTAQIEWEHIAEPGQEFESQLRRGGGSERDQAGQWPTASSNTIHKEQLEN